MSRRARARGGATAVAGSGEKERPFAKTSTRHAEWARVILEAHGLRQKDPRQAQALLQSLSRRVRAEAAAHLGEWHLQQTETFRAYDLKEAGMTAEACRALGAWIRKERSIYRYWGTSLGSHLNTLALWMAERGKPREAERLGREALRLLGEFPDPTPFHEKLVATLRGIYEERARAKPAKRRSHRSGRESIERRGT